MKQDTPSQGMHKSEYILRLFESGRSIPLGTHPLVNTCFMITKIGIRNLLMKQITVDIKLETCNGTSDLPQWAMHSTQRIGSASVIVLILLVITVVDFLSTVHVSNLQNLDSQYWDITKHQPIEKIACSRKLTCSEVVACSGLLSSRNRNKRGNLREIP